MMDRMTYRESMMNNLMIKKSVKYENINTPVLTEKDFNYEVPAGTALKQGIYGEKVEKVKNLVLEK